MGAPKGNKFAAGLTNSGRPPHFETPGDLQDAVLEYFLDDNVKHTITGLALHLGFCSRSSFDDYEKRGDEFSYIIKRAKLAVENSYELSGQPFDIFALKNMGWKDRTETELSGSMGIVWNEQKTYDPKQEDIGGSA